MPLTNAPQFVVADSASPRTIALGDSIVLGPLNSTSGAASNQQNSDNFFLYGCMASKQRMLFYKNAGVNGDTTAQMLARIQADVIAYKPGYCVVMGGTNDISQAIAFTTQTANLTAICNRLKQNNIAPVLCTIPPGSLTGGLSGTVASRHQDTQKLNAWILAYAARNGIPVFDIWRATADPATGNFKAGMASDGIHPGFSAYGPMAQVMVPTITQYWPNTSPYLQTQIDDTVNMIPNGLYINSSAGVATSWVGGGDNASATFTIGTFPNILGNVQSIVYPGASLVTFAVSSAITTGFSVGDRIAFSGRFTAQGFSLNGAGTWSFYTTYTGSSGSPRASAAFAAHVDFSQATTFYIEDVVPVGTTSLVPTVLLQPGSCNVKFGQMSLINLTTLGLA